MPFKNFLKWGRRSKNESARHSILKAKLFNSDYYLASNPDVAATGQDPLTHYLKNGYREGRRPIPYFNPRDYLAANPDVAEAGIEPLTHYAVFGQAEERPLKLCGVVQPPSSQRIRREAVTGRTYFEYSGFSAVLKNPAYKAIDNAIRNLISCSTKIRVESRQPDVSIVIPTSGQLHFLLNCLASLADHLSRYKVEIIVVNNIQHIKQQAKRLGEIPWIQYHYHEKDNGYFGSCNYGAALARGEYIVLLDSNTRVVEGWLDELIGSFELFPRAGLIGSKLLNEDATLQEAGGIIWQDGSFCSYGLNDDPDHPKYCFARQVDYCSGDAIAFTSEAWWRMCGFDTMHVSDHCNDADIACRLRSAGYEVWFQPLSCVIHYTCRTQIHNNTSQVMLSKNNICSSFTNRWKNVLESHQPNGQNIDREANRRAGDRLLVLDAITPTPDRDSGSFITVRMIRALQQSGYQVTFVPQFSYAFDGRYTEALQRQGVECMYVPHMQQLDDVLSFRSDFEIVLAYRVGVLNGVYEKIRERLPRTRIIFHTVDLHHLREAREADLFDNSRGRISAFLTKCAELELIARSDCVIVHTNTETKFLENYLSIKNIVEFPYVAELYCTKTSFNNRHDIIFLGGFVHKPNVDAILHFVRATWPLLLSCLPEHARLLIVGDSPPAAIRTLANERIVVTGYVEDLQMYFDKARVSIAPLRYGAGIKGKVIQSLCYGVPSVVTSIAAEGIGLTSSLNTLIADDSQDFANSIISVYNDQMLWSHLQRSGYDFARQNFSWEIGLETTRRAIKVADQTWITRQERALRRRLAALGAAEPPFENG